MATFTNQATLSYNGIVTNSNIVTGELVEVLSATKTATVNTYTGNDTVTYVISIINSGSTAFTGLTLTDNLGSYAFGTDTLVPLTYVENSVLYYNNGVLQTTPAVTAGPPLTITGISVPANGNATIIYEASVNEFAPTSTGSSITNTATITGQGITTPLTATETVTVQDAPALTITKSISPTSVTENGQLTYTFVIQNSGNTPAVAADDIVVTDTFNPILNPITVTYNGIAWTEAANYSYNEATGLFSTIAGQITVPAATYTQDTETGAYITTPGTSVLVVTGTV